MASADLKKLHGGAASHTRNHIYRHDGKDVVYKNEHIDKSKTHLNTEMRFPEHEGIVLSDDEDRFLRARVSEIDKKEPPIRVRKDRVTFVAFEAPVPDGTDTKEKEEAFFKIFYEEVARMCGGPQNVGVLKIHRDEIHPYIDPVTLDEKMSRVHAHCIGIPYVRGKGINCKMFMSKGNLRSLQNALDTRCREELGVSYLSRDEHAVLRGRRVEDVKITSAKCIVIATNSYESTHKTVDTARRLNPDIHIIVRTRYVKNVDELYELGADEVIPEEFETSILMFSKVMDHYNKDVDEILDTIDTLRSDHYDTFRCVSPEEITATLNERITNLNVESIYVTERKQLDDYDFYDYDLTVTSIIRNNKTIVGFSPNAQLEVDDLILFTGDPENIENFIKNVYGEKNEILG